jgi:hypothetical protein
MFALTFRLLVLCLLTLPISKVGKRNGRKAAAEYCRCEAGRTDRPRGRTAVHTLGTSPSCLLTQLNAVGEYWGKTTSIRVISSLHNIEQLYSCSLR